jgi:putative transposase
VAVNAELRAELRRLRRGLERLRVENEVLHEAAQPLIHQARAHERFAFIHRLRGRFAVRRLCRILVTDRSNYYPWTGAQARRKARAGQGQELTELVVEIHTAYPACGAERITRELNRQGFEVG